VTTRHVLRRAAFGIAGLVVLLVIVALVAIGLFALRLKRSVPRLDGVVSASELSAPVTIARDANGVPTITGRTRADVAFATGYLHAQERFFQMDQLRRAAAGELGELFGSAGLDIDRHTRLHLFRARARHLVAHMPRAERAMLAAYVAGVNRGLGDLRAPPFEYALLRATPRPWRAQDSLLVVYAMYLDLQGVGPELELNRARAAARVGRGMTDLLYPLGTELDTALDGSVATNPALPPPFKAIPPGRSGTPVERVVKGSNNWAVGGRLTATGAAMVANDMHLGTRIPNTWYRVRLVVPHALDAVGVTLPGVFPIVVGSNGHVAWGFTDAYVDTHDAVIVEPVAGRAGWYRTPHGPRQIVLRHERLCAARCTDLPVRGTIWGPIVARLPDGREVADRWIAHDADAIRLAPMLALEQARSVPQAIAAAHALALPEENFVVGDAEGHIAWTIAGQVPRRFGWAGRDAASWADGSRGWVGYFPPDEVPTIIDPPNARVWTANARVVGGAALRKLGDGGYDDGGRAREIGRRLFAREHFAERDMLAIQLDTTSGRARFWRGVLLRTLARHDDPRSRAMIVTLMQWNGRADANSVAYRLIRTFRANVIDKAYAAYVGAPDIKHPKNYALPSAEQAMRTLLRARPPGLVPPAYASWDAFLDTSLAALNNSIDTAAGGDLRRFGWARWLHADVHHPLAGAIPLLGLLTDPKDQGMPGDGGVPRAQYRGTGASERLVVSPGHETEGLFHMPGGQSGAPFAPYYLAGHRDWVEGRAAPLLPGPTKWTLTLRPNP
jgi:penicillin amidase